MPANSLCFKEARDARANGEINLDQYLRHIMAHYRGLRHMTDAEGQRPWFPAGFEDEVREIVLNEDFRPLEEDDTAFIHSIFLSAFQGDVVTVRELLNSSTTAPEYYLRPLTTISIHEGNPKLLRLCFEIGFRPAGYNDSDSVLYWRVRNNPSTAWLDVLFDYDFYHWRTDPQQLNKRQIWHYVFSMGPDCTRWWIDHGGCTPSARGLFEQPQRWPGATVFRILLDQFGINWFKNSGTLQLAAKNQDLETVKMLVEAGADVNEDVADWQWDIREHRAAPSPALNEAVYAKSEKTIRYLVEQGARLPRMYIDDPYNTIPEEYKIFKKLVVDLGGVEQENPS